MYPAGLPYVTNGNQPAERMMRLDSKITTFFKWFGYFTRLWGIFTSIVLFGVGMDTAYHRHISGYYLIGASAAIFFLETTWVVTLFLQLCIRYERDKIFRCWNVVGWLEEWKKSILYAPLGVVPILWPHGLWMSYASSGQLFSLALFHFILTFKNVRCQIRKSRFSNGDVESIESSKYEEVLDDVLPAGSPLIFSDNLVQEQDTLVEI